MRRWTVRTVHVSAVLVACALVLEGPDLLLLGVVDARYWLPVGLASGLLTLPLLWVRGVGFVPPWTMPVYHDGKRRARLVGYHLACAVAAAWLWTYPTFTLVAWVRQRRRVTGDVGTVSGDAVSVVGGVLLAELLFLVPTLVLFVRLSSFRTPVNLDTARGRDLLRTALVAVGSYVVVRAAAALVVMLVTAG